MTMTRKELMTKLHAQETKERNRRCARIMRAVKAVGRDFRDDELNALEAVAERAYGRVQLARR